MTSLSFTRFPPTREAALARCADFVPQAGRPYAAGRNFDREEWENQSVSALSPYLSRRMITEREVVSTVMETHAPNQAEKYLQEICWRTYWKGWLEQRPSVWQSYLNECKEDARRWSEDASLAERWETAVSGRTHITAFNHWVEELCSVGYLHNHARMWFAGIWIYDLGLPWTLGADFFYQNLLDRDAASNTLSWRWVAGLQTRGKRYKPSAGNIHKFTEGRFDESATLSCDEEGPEFKEPPDRQLPEFPENTGESPEVLLIHRDDLALDVPDEWASNLKQVILLDIPSSLPDIDASDHVKAFDEATLQDAEERWSSIAECKRLTFEEFPEWWKQYGEESYAIPWAPVGAVRDALETAWEPCGKRPRLLLRDWDRTLWPLATAGFFSFWKKVNFNVSEGFARPAKVLHG